MCTWALFRVIINEPDDTLGLCTARPNGRDFPTASPFNHDRTADDAGGVIALLPLPAGTADRWRFGGGTVLHIAVLWPASIAYARN